MVSERLSDRAAIEQALAEAETAIYYGHASTELTRVAATLARASSLNPRHRSTP